MYNSLFKYQTYLFAGAIFLMLLSVSFNINGNSINLAWRDQPIVAVLLLAFGLGLLAVYIQIDKYRIEQLKNQIANNQMSKSQNRSKLLDSLTDRQLQVYQLIMQGKSNKEIIGELFIEPSTLKTHINQLYKKLNISNRRELRNLNSDK